MKPRKPRKSVGPGAAWKEMQRTADLRMKKDEECKKHRSKINDLQMQRRMASLEPDPEIRAIKLARIAQKEIDENQRHQATLSRLIKRIHKKP
ncbi:hypothetical protein KBI52_02675 [Microvirga sp. HBU67558]|uniref:hypothetical protein n=1 Tax=Microvirga TaxID=186650 RepID=UPI001B39686F|nr:MULTISPECIES: hypothetical protein [unclassified Microvirga]MBQ0819149.1 hypothetical protein [Microvirga sp. HBU67558]